MSQFFSRLFPPKWHPREGTVYKSWTKGTSHFGKEAIVNILFDNKEYNGTFSVHNGLCEIRTGEAVWKWHLNSGYMGIRNARKIITPVENVSFQKEIKHIDSIPTLGQNGYAGTKIRYTAKILDSNKITNIEFVH